MSYAPDDGGLFTDTANYTGLIPECTNLSVGYFRAHSPSEWLDWGHLEPMLSALKALNVNDLPVEREPSVDDFYADDFYSRWDEGLSDYYTEGKGKRSSRVDLIRNNAEAISEFLDQWGVDDTELEEVIFRYSGTVRT